MNEIAKHPNLKWLALPEDSCKPLVFEGRLIIPFKKILNAADPEEGWQTDEDQFGFQLYDYNDLSKPSESVLFQKVFPIQDTGSDAIREIKFTFIKDFKLVIIFENPFSRDDGWGEELIELSYDLKNKTWAEREFADEDSELFDEEESHYKKQSVKNLKQRPLAMSFLAVTGKSESEIDVSVYYSLDGVENEVFKAFEGKDFPEDFYAGMVSEYPVDLSNSGKTRTGFFVFFRYKDVNAPDRFCGAPTVCRLVVIEE